jgi:hypothetical protein
MQQDHAARTYCMDMVLHDGLRHVLVAWTYSMDMDMQHAINMDKQHAMNMDMQHGMDICSMDIDLDIDMDMNTDMDMDVNMVMYYYCGVLQRSIRFNRRM